MLNYTVHNYMEDIVAGLVKEVYREKPDVCTCETCFLDICALVLNKVKPQYLETKIDLKGLEPFLQTQVRSKVLDAMVLVANNPRQNHGKDQICSGKLHNLSESLIRKMLTDILESHPNKEKIRDSIPLIASLVLNEVEPRYAVTDRGGAFMRLVELEHQFLPSTMSKVFNAIKQVQEQV